MAIYLAHVVVVVARTALAVSIVVHMVGSFAHFVSTAPAVDIVVVVAAVPTAETMVAQAALVVTTEDTAQPLLAVSVDH